MIRDSSDKACELNYTEHLFSRNKEIEISNKLNVQNSNQEIFLCNHIKALEFELFYSFLIFFYISHEKITIDGFYTILYLLKYFKVQCDNKLRDVLKNIFVSLLRSNDITNLDVTKILFDLSKKEIFSHEFFKKIAEEFFNLFIPAIDYPIDEIIFYKIPIQDQLIISLNINSNFASMKRIIFLESMKETNMKFSYNLLAVNEIIFYDQFYIYQEDKIVESLILKELTI
ncbi:hypothetical protein CWI37_0116p0060 [Hamiltosporidium tvaerminnensis]|uniref:Uncharacterized protein n=1 Tax=Hamiltosporidium tvaerminnensis TaxID=1176355 RepID=A0A4V6MVE5_9MICR|nr:hypothetical protein CWI37_0116p0060 [Hamiltosporidium tvaerminnensis]